MVIAKSAETRRGTILAGNLSNASLLNCRYGSVKQTQSELSKTKDLDSKWPLYILRENTDNLQEQKKEAKERKLRMMEREYGCGNIPYSSLQRSLHDCIKSFCLTQQHATRVFDILLDLQRN